SFHKGHHFGRSTRLARRDALRFGQERSLPFPGSPSGGGHLEPQSVATNGRPWYRPRHCRLARQACSSVRLSSMPRSLAPSIRITPDAMANSFIFFGDGTQHGMGDHLTEERLNLSRAYQRSDQWAFTGDASGPSALL